MSAPAAHGSPAPASRADPGTQPDLSIIVVTHNRAELALATLASAAAAMGTLSVEWLVVDSGSSDGTPEAIEARHPEIEVLRCANVGFAAANNLGIARARGRHLLLLNPDVEILRGRFDTLVARLDAEPRLGLVSVIQRAADGSLLPSRRRDPTVWRTLAEAFGAGSERLGRRWGERDLIAGHYLEERDADWLVGALMLVRARALTALGGFDERFFLYSEETDLCLRLRHNGWRVAHLPQMEIVHHTAAAYRPDLLGQLAHAKVLLAAKHHGALSGTAMRAALILRHGLRSGALALGLLGGGGDRPARLAAETHALAVLTGVAAPLSGDPRRGPEVHPRPGRSS